MTLEIVIAFFGSAVALAFMPGPDNIFVLTESLMKGRTVGYAISLGLSLGVIIHTLAVATGVAVLIQSNPNVLLVFKLIGVAYLLYLAVKSLQEKPIAITNANSLEQGNTFAIIKKAFFMNVLNPKVMLFFVALFPQFIVPSEMSNGLQIILLGAIFMCTSFLVFAFIAAMASNITKYLNKPKFWVVLKWVKFSVLIGISLLLLV